MDATQSTPTTQTVLLGTVFKWFQGKKNPDEPANPYGFVKLDDGREAHLHWSKLDKFKKLPEGLSLVDCRVEVAQLQNSDKGWKITDCFLIPQKQVAYHTQGVILLFDQFHADDRRLTETYQGITKPSTENPAITLNTVALEKAAKDGCPEEVIAQVKSYFKSLERELRSDEAKTQAITEVVNLITEGLIPPTMSLVILPRYTPAPAISVSPEVYGLFYQDWETFTQALVDKNQVSGYNKHFVWAIIDQPNIPDRLMGQDKTSEMSFVFEQYQSEDVPAEVSKRIFLGKLSCQNTLFQLKFPTT